MFIETANPQFHEALEERNSPTFWQRRKHFAPTELGSLPLDCYKHSAPTEPGPDLRTTFRTSLAELHLTCLLSHLFVRIRCRQLGSGAICVLEFVEFPVKSVLRQQFLMRAAFSYLTMMQHDDLIGALNC